MTERQRAKPRPIAKCLIRPGDDCRLCFSGATGPEDCGLVYLVLGDPELRDQLAQIRLEQLSAPLPG